jgi:hypothetical protein
MMFGQGCQIFLGTTYQNGENVPKNKKNYQMVTKYTNIAYCKAIHNWESRFENMPFGNPVFGY